MNHIPGPNPGDGAPDVGFPGGYSDVLIPSLIANQPQTVITGLGQQSCSAGGAHGVVQFDMPHGSGVPLQSCGVQQQQQTVTSFTGAPGPVGHPAMPHMLPPGKFPPPSAPFPPPRSLVPSPFMHQSIQPVKKPAHDGSCIQ